MVNCIAVRNLLLIILIIAPWHLCAGENPWYTQGKFKPLQRLEFTLSNTLDFDRENAPITIKREDFPIPDLHEMWVTIVDPSLPSFEGPSEEFMTTPSGLHTRRKF